METKVTKKQIKEIKKEIISETAVNVGYNLNVVQKLPTYAIVEATRNISTNNLIKSDTSEADATNILVTESIKVIGFQDFKEVMPYFFNYTRILNQNN